MEPKRLIVYVPGIGGKTERWQPLIERLTKDIRLSPEDLLPFDHKSHIFSFGSAKDLGQKLSNEVDIRWRASGPYDEIIFVGHSMGGILVRQAYLFGADTYNQNLNPAAWYHKVKRFVLLAAINRGYTPTRWYEKLFDIFTRFISWMTTKKILAQDFMHGSDFITDLRLQWIREFHKLPDEHQPTVIQILGEKDDVVTKDDSVDIEQFRNGYQFPLIPDVSHLVLPYLDKGKNVDMRYEYIRDAILGHNLDRARAHQEIPSKKNVVFILHGIRDSNRDWVNDLHGLIKDQDKLNETEVVPPSYGYLSALEFAFPFLHRWPIRWFQSQYSDYFAKYPDAEFHFFGHSNGTYILGESLKALSGMKFTNVALAGSALPANFDWSARFNAQQFKCLRNDQAKLDWPIGILCSGLNGVGVTDIGTGGYEGFRVAWDDVRQFSFFDGGHVKALENDNLKSIKDFLTDGSKAPKPAGLVEEYKFFSFLSRLAPWIFRLLIAIFLLVVVVAFIQHAWAVLIALGMALLLIAFLLKVA